METNPAVVAHCMLSPSTLHPPPHHALLSHPYQQHAGGVAHEELYQTKGVGRAVLTHEVGRGVATRQLQRVLE